MFDHFIYYLDSQRSRRKSETDEQGELQALKGINFGSNFQFLETAKVNAKVKSRFMDDLINNENKFKYMSLKKLPSSLAYFSSTSSIPQIKKSNKRVPNLQKSSSGINK